jgi:hypothetical protein
LDYMEHLLASQLMLQPGSTGLSIKVMTKFINNLFSD